MGDASAANVVQRPSTNANRVSVSRPTQAASRMPTMTVQTGSTSTSVSTTSTNTETTAQTETKPEPVVETPATTNKSSQFSSGLASKSATETDTAAATLAELVRAQRAALDLESVKSAMNADLSGSGENSCDTALRECMIQKCGSNFSKCIADTDTTFFDKMDTCRRSTKCTGHEYQLFSAEIKADRDAFAKLAAYNATIDCGNSYDTCIVGQCGATYSKCIGKSAGDNAIAKCESIAKSCIEYDSGMALRTMAIFGELRQTAERQIATDEQKLYALREQMRSVCTRLGAMFDERSLDCVYTVNFYAGNDNTLFASKKLYAGSTFDCTQNWFGIDVTTFRENAFRETRAQTSASSAMLGSGLGQAVGAYTSGAIDRAIDRFKADNALNDALEECMKKYTESECRAKIGTTTKEKTGKDSGGTPTMPEEVRKAAKQLQKGAQNGGLGAAAAVAGGGSATQKSGHSAQGSDTPTDSAYIAETQELLGFVVDSTTGAPLDDVTVGVKDADNDTHTSDGGSYKLSNIAPDAEIEFLHEDYTALTIKAKEVPSKVKLNKTVASTGATGDLPDECNEEMDWHTLKHSGVYTYLSGGIHQDETRKNYDKVVDKLKAKCKDAGGTYNEYKETLDGPLAMNICGTYNKFIRHVCEFKDGDTSSGSIRCKKNFYPKYTGVNGDDTVEGLGGPIRGTQGFSQAKMQLSDEELRKVEYYDACEFLWGGSDSDHKQEGTVKK